MSAGKVERGGRATASSRSASPERPVRYSLFRHNFEFDPKTGESATEPGRMRLKTYPVETLVRV